MLVSLSVMGGCQRVQDVRSESPEHLGAIALAGESLSEPLMSPERVEVQLAGERFRVALPNQIPKVLLTVHEIRQSS